MWLDHKLDKWRAEANILFACLGVSSDHQELLYVTRCYFFSQHEHWEGEEKYLPAQEVKSFSDQNSSLVVPTIYDEAVSNYNPKLRLKLPVPSIVFLGSTLCNPLVSFPSQYQVKNKIYIRTNMKNNTCTLMVSTFLCQRSKIFLTIRTSQYEVFERFIILNTA